MTNAEIPFFDCLTGEEAEASARIMAALRESAWAQPLLRNLPDAARLTHEHKAALFELRFGYALHELGIAPRYEVPGEAGSTLDFGFEHGGRPWLAELMRLEETDAVRDATHARVDEDGIKWRERILCTGAGNGSFRTFAHGGDAWDRLHVGLGGDGLPPEVRHLWNGKPITGVFDPRTRVRGAQYARERVHFLGFVNERAFGPGAFGAATQFIANPALFADAREALAAWPLQPARFLNGAD